MAEVSIRELRNHGGDVVDRVQAGELVTVTKSGRPVAEMRAVGRPTLHAAVLLQRWRRVPVLDRAELRRDVDAVLDPSL